MTPPPTVALSDRLANPLRLSFFLSKSTESRPPPLLTDVRGLSEARVALPEEVFLTDGPEFRHASLCYEAGLVSDLLGHPDDDRKRGAT